MSSANLIENNAPESNSLWFVARTIAQVELKMRKYFEDHQIECFVPVVTELRKWKGVVTEVEIPVIRNLIFFKADYTLAHTVFNLNSRKIYRVYDKKEMLCVPERQMDMFIRFVNENYGRVMILDTGYVVGDKMMIKKGPFAGLVGKVTQIDNKNYFTVSLDGLLVAAVKFPKSNLIKVEEADEKDASKKYKF